MFKKDSSQLQHLSNKLGIKNTNKEMLQSAYGLVSTAIDKKLIAKDMRKDFESSILKILYSINSHNMKIDDVKVTVE